MPWMATVSGKALDLLNPTVDQVNFRDMAISLSQLNRWCGQSQAIVPVALHLIIGCDIAPPELRPWWVLHDGHEERIGDMISPVKVLFRTLAHQMFGPEAAAQIEAVLKEAERRHDAVIYEAAGLPLPTLAQKIEIKRVDVMAAATEMRDFHGPQERAWSPHAIKAHSKVYRPMAAPKAAEQLFDLFSRYLPALANGRAA